MENSVWRPMTRIVAIIDIILSLWLIFCVVTHRYVMVLLYALSGGLKGKQTLEEDDYMEYVRPLSPSLLWTITTLLVLVILLIVIHILAAIKLLCATPIAGNPETALRTARIYRILLILLFALTFAACFIDVKDMLRMGIILFWRCLTVYVAHKFIQDLGTLNQCSTNEMLQF